MGEDVPARPTVEVDLLGTFRLRVEGRPVSLPAARLRVVLAILAMSADRPVSVDRVAEAVWGEELPDNVRATIQTYVSRLRGLLGAGSITTEPSGYALRISSGDVDARRFSRLVDEVEQDAVANRSRLVEALRLWRGTPFEDLDSPWLQEYEGHRLEERRLKALEQRIELDLADGRHAEVIAELTDMTEAHPLRETFAAQFIRALAGSGRRAEALDRYEAIRARIADELGVDPSEDLQRLHAHVLDGGPESDRVPVVSAAVVTPVVPRQLPADVTRFTARASALATLDDLAHRSATGQMVVVAVHGIGGIGKTSLVVHWAHQAAHQFPDGQVYLNLRGYGDGSPLAPNAALEVLLRSLGTAAEAIPAEQETRSSLLRSLLAHRRTLVLLDNAYDAAQVRPLLPGTGGSMAVITSRSGLGGLVAREDAFRIAVDQLDPEESVRLLASALDFRGIPYEKADLVALAEQCGQLPLALAIAAERASREPHTGLSHLLDELQQVHNRLDVLYSGDDSTDLRTVFAWSYRNLDDATARAFRLLGTYPPTSFGVPAVAALLDTSTTDARRLLDRLVDANLLLHRHRGRYDFHDLIRTYAAELADRDLSAAEREAAFDRFFAWATHSVHGGRKTINSIQVILEPDGKPPSRSQLTFADADAALRWFGAEQGALIAIAQAAVGVAPGRSTFALIDGLAYYFGHLHTVVDWAALLEPAIAAAQCSGDLVAEAQLSHRLGRLHAANAEYEIARRHIERGRELFATAGHLRGEIRTLDNLAVILDFLGDPTAITRHEEALQTANTLGDPYETINPMNNLADAYVRLGRLDEGAVLCRDALKLCRQRDEPAPSEGLIWDTLGTARVKQERYAEAIECYDNALAVSRKQRNRWGEAIVLTNLGKCFKAANRYHEATDAWREVLDLLDDLGVSNGTHISRDEVLEMLASVTPTPT